MIRDQCAVWRKIRIEIPVLVIRKIDRIAPVEIRESKVGNRRVFLRTAADGRHPNDMQKDAGQFAGKHVPVNYLSIDSCGETVSTRLLSIGLLLVFGLLVGDEDFFI